MIEAAGAPADASTMGWWRVGGALTPGALGVRVSVDDLGTGSASFAHIAEMPVDELKIDRPLVGAVAQSGWALVPAGIVEMAHVLGLTVVAEGVETPGQATALVNIGCDAAQGFSFARPVPLGVLVGVLGGPAPADEPRLSGV